MNKVITINLDGTAFQLEEAGYNALHNYIETASTRLEGNPDREEILSDIERAIAEKFRGLLNSNKTVVVTKEVSAVIEEMGPIEGESGEGAEAGAASAGGTSSGGGGAKSAQEPRGAGFGGMPRRLYKIHEGAMLSGVCNGIAAHFNIDPTFVRLGFVFLTMLWGTGLLVYIVMAIVVPEAKSPEQKAAASGTPFTSQEFIRRAKEGYYGAMKNFPDKQARREWKRQFKQQMRASAFQWQHNWHGYWAERAPMHPGMGFTLPFLSLMQGAAVVLLIWGLISLLSGGALFGMALPAKVPVWLAVVLLLMAYGVLSVPIKLARRACYWSMGQPRWAGPFVFVADALVWIVVAGALVWLGIHFFPELREAVQSIPSVAHQGADDIQKWWKTK